MSETKPPKEGQKIFIPEMNLYGEIVELYHNGADLVSKVKVLINGKPTIIDVTLLVVQAAELVKFGAVLFGKLKAAAKRICTALGWCKAKPIIPVAFRQTLEKLNVEFDGQRPTNEQREKAKVLQQKWDSVK